jgi:serine/threonine protein kinase
MLCPDYGNAADDDSQEEVTTAPETNQDLVMMRELFDGEEILETIYLKSFSDLYSVRDLLGVGAYGVVLLVKNKKTQEKSALKIINKQVLSQRALGILKNESKIMKGMKHNNVVKFKHIYENQKFLMIEMEYIPGG